MYQPLRVFFYTGGLLILLGTALSVRYLYFMTIGEGSGHVQSVILAAVFLLLGFIMNMIGLLADVTAANRKLIEEALYRIKKDSLS